MLTSLRDEISEALGGGNAVESYDPERDVWQVEKSLNFSRTGAISPPSGIFQLPGTDSDSLSDFLNDFVVKSNVCPVNPTFKPAFSEIVL